MKSYFLFNPLAGKGRAEQFALEIDSENPNATKLYTSLGFRPINIREFMGIPMTHMQKEVK